ncbi:MAG: hypothetical protein H7A23_26915 [Leptospiraceae bacterium]|nr:hypothetical protein [Leptospiraceae bacterium]MCP5498203.1 hypothetical protein [Leptospiraceae bacterium]
MKKLFFIALVGIIANCSSEQKVEKSPQKPIPIYKTCGDCRNFHIPDREKSEHLIKITNAYSKMDTIKLETNYASQRRR